MEYNYLLSAAIIFSLCYSSNQECHQKLYSYYNRGIECNNVTNLMEELKPALSLSYSRKVTVKNSNLTVISTNYVDTNLMDELIFTNCRIDTIDSNAFKGNRITELMLEGNGIRHLNSPAFVSTTLISLSLANNSLTNIQKGVFSNIRFIQNLILSQNNIETIEGLTDLNQLEMLDISQNSKLQIAFWNDLKKLTKIKKINLSFCNLDNTPSGLSEWKYLQEIDLSGNNLKTLDGDDFPPTLLTLTASTNAVKFLNNSWQHLLKLTSLDLSNNFLSNQYSPLDNLISLRELNLQNTTIEESFFQNNSNKLNQLTSINLDNNRFTKFDCKIFENNTKLRRISITANTIQSIINIENCPKSINLFNISNNQLKLGKPLSELSSLDTLDLSYNELDTIAPDTFQNLTKLFGLYLNGNYIKKLPVSCFKDLNGLRNLQMQHNFISNLSHGVFTGLRGLRMINLAYNKLNEVDEEVFSGLKYLTDFDISWNKLENFDVTRALSHIHHSVTVNLDGNKYSCSTLARISKSSDFVYGNTFNESNVNGIRCDDVQENKNNSNLTFLEDHIKSMSSKLNVVTVLLILLFIVVIVNILSKCVKRYLVLSSPYSVKFRKEDKEPIHLDF